MLLLITIISALVVVGVSAVLLRFDLSKNPTTIVAYRPNVSGAAYQSGKPIDIYSMALFMIVIALSSVVLSARIYPLRRSIAIFILGSSVILILLAIRVSWSIVSIQ